jgi:hypothetical protein
MGEKIAFTVVKDEAPFLLEWVAFQRMIGFDTVIVYSNNSTDDTDQLLTALAAEGLVEHHIHDPGGIAPQGHAAWMLRRSGRVKTGDWIMLSDPDEFLNIKFGSRRLEDLLGVLEQKQGILVPWRLFGDAGQARFSGRSIDPVYCRAAADPNPNNRVVKTLLRYGPEVSFLGIHTPNMVADYWLNGKPFVSGKLTDIDPKLPNYAKWREQGQIAACEAQDTSYEHVQMNHHFTRSRACFAMKYRRGHGGMRPKNAATEPSVYADGRYGVYADERYVTSNCNDVEDRSILALKPGLDEMLARFRAIPTIGMVQNKIEQAFQAYEADYLSERGNHGNAG